MCTQTEIKITFSLKGSNEATQNCERIIIIRLSWKIVAGKCYKNEMSVCIF